MDGHLVCFAGNVGADVVLRETGDGMSVAEFSIAQEVNPKDRSSNKVSWWKVEAWGPLATKISLSSFSKNEDDEPVAGGIKGARLIICGRVDLRHWTDDAGTQRTNPTIIADEIAFSTHFGPIDAIKLPIPSSNVSHSQGTSAKGFNPEEPY